MPENLPFFNLNITICVKSSIKTQKNIEHKKGSWNGFQEK